MAEIFSRDELNQCSKEVLITLFLNLQEQMIEMNGKLDRLAEQLAVARNHRYGRKSEKLDVIDGQLCFNFNEAEVCDVASSAYLPHSGKSRLGCEAGAVMKFVFIPFVYCWRAGSD